MEYRRVVVLLLVSAVLSEAAKKKAHPNDPPPTKVQAEDVVAHLEETISWYHAVGAAEQLSGVPTDLVARDTTLQRSLQSLQLAFDFARAEAAFLAAEKREANASANPGSAQESGASGHNLAQAAVMAAQRVVAAQKQLDDVTAKLAHASAKDRSVLDARRHEIEAQLVLAKQVQSTIQGMLSVVGEGSYGSTNAAGLLGQIATLERSVPEARHVVKTQPIDAVAQPQATPTATAAPKPATSAATSNAVNVFHPESAGLVNLVTELISLQRAKASLDDVLDESDALSKDIDRLKAPLINMLRASIERSQTLVDNSNAQTAEQILGDEKEIENLTARFKQLSTATVPIGEQQLLVAAVRTSLASWRNSIVRQTSDAEKYLFMRIVFIGLAVIFVLVFSEVWKRATMRYITDPRRRRQFVVLRRVVVTVAVILIVTLGFVTDFGSIATYAGFLTAGIALGLQNMILSVVAYFFLIGKYGIKVGDRVTISGVTGDVIDIGLVRLYMMELTGSGHDMHPTGRTVVYANSIVFQPSALFKHVSGADYVWHTVTLTLQPNSNYDAAKAKLMKVVQDIFNDYRTEIAVQHKAFSKSVDMEIEAPEPDCQLMFVEDGLEFRVRYPADWKRAPGMDERILRGLRETIEKEPELHASSAPKLVFEKAA